MSILHLGCGVTHLLRMFQRPNPARFQNAAGRLPAEPKFFGQKSIWCRRRDVVIRRCFSRSVEVWRVDLLLRLAPGSGIFEAMGDIRDAKSFLQ